MVDIPQPPRVKYDDYGDFQEKQKSSTMKMTSSYRSKSPILTTKREPSLKKGDVNNAIIENQVLKARNTTL